MVLKTNNMFFKAQITANLTNSKMLTLESDIANDGKTRYAMGSTKEPL